MESYLNELDGSHLSGSCSTWKAKKDFIESKEAKVSTTGPESGIWFEKASRKASSIFYLDYRTVDHKYNIVTDVYFTPGNVHHSTPNLERLIYKCRRLVFEESLEAVALDAGYFTAPICLKLQQQYNIYAVIGGRSYTPKKGLIAK